MDDFLSKKGLQEKLKAFEGIDPVETRKLMEQFQKDKDLQLLKDGKLPAPFSE